MIKYEIKVELSYDEEIKNVIEKVYFSDGNNGKIIGNNKHYINIPSTDDINYSIFRGLDGCTVKILNSIIDGSFRFIVSEQSDGIRLFPISIYAIKDGDKYIFY